MQSAERRRVALLVALVAILTTPGSGARAEPPPDTDPALHVPYLPQTEALCGGAAAAMLFRYWGDRHADVQQFAPLVDRSEGGIADAALAQAIRDRHWSVTKLDGSLETLRRELHERRPPMLLIEDRPGKFHYVVAVEADDEGVTFHDPAWGPSRRLSTDELQRAWQQSGFWMLRVTPAPGGVPSVAASRTRPATSASRPRSEPDTCDGRLDAALDQIATRGRDQAAALLEPLVAACPQSAGPRRELAAVRFTEQRWADAAALAKEALDRRPGDAYAADVLASSRFMLNDFDGALRAWNLAGKPALDSMQITGLTRSRYALVAQATGLTPNTLLTADAFRLARRRIESLPDFDSTRLALRPADEGWAVADLAVVEQPTLPKTVVQWLAAAAQSLIDRDVSVMVPGRTGQGETWTGEWGFQDRRPRVAMTFAAPHLRHPNGVWRAAVAWQEQTYGSSAATEERERWLQGQFAMATWIHPDVRLEVASGLDGWTRDSGRDERSVHIAGAAERRFGGDRGALQLSAARWFGLGDTDNFGAARADLSIVIGRETSPVLLSLRSDVSAASEGSPMGVWDGAGEGRGRPPLLRAHALLQDSRVGGSVFGRRLAHATIEGQHWLARPTLVRIAGALFADMATAAGRPSFAVGPAAQVDVGAGLRLRVPGRSGVFRIDYAHGVRDGANVISVGWQSPTVLPAASPTP